MIENEKVNSRLGNVCAESGIKVHHSPNTNTSRGVKPGLNLKKMQMLANHYERKVDDTGIALVVTKITSTNPSTNNVVSCLNLLTMKHLKISATILP